MNKKILIIGAGISGIYLAHLLKNAGFIVQILEANHRIGGRIYTKISHETKVELGATWLWKYNPELLKLCKELNISLFEQNMEGDALYEAGKLESPQRFQVPKNQEISYRIVGGTKTILDKLMNNLSDKEIILNQKVIKIHENKKSINVITEESEFHSDYVITTIPPQLLVNSIEFNPKLDKNLFQIATNTHTWMENSIKFAVTFKTAFWKEKGLSGVGFSNVGPFTEMYNHTDYENEKFALMGFLNSNLSSNTKGERENKVAEQLIKFFGSDGENCIAYEEKVWNQEPLLSAENSHFLAPHFNNGNPIYQNTFLNGKLIIAGSETSPSFGGYMEGAIYRGNEILNQLITEDL